MAGGHVLIRGAGEADRVETEMRAEAAVLDGDEGVGDIGRQALDIDALALSQAAARDQAAIDVQNGDVVGVVLDQELGGVGQV